LIELWTYPFAQDQDDPGPTYRRQVPPLIKVKTLRKDKLKDKRGGDVASLIDLVMIYYNDREHIVLYS
jgi:hypothetical protein